MEIYFKHADMQDVDTIVLMQKELNNMLELQDLDEEAFKKYIQKDMQSEKTAYFIAKNNSETIGVVVVDFSDAISIDDSLDYEASISLIYVDKRYRTGTIAYELFKIAIEEMCNRGKYSFVMSVEDNNPNKFLHFALADVLIEENQENTKNGTTTQYLLGVSDINKIKSYSFKDFLRKSIEIKKEFSQVLQTMPRAETIAYLY